MNDDSNKAMEMLTELYKVLLGGGPSSLSGISNYCNGTDPPATCLVIRVHTVKRIPCMNSGI